MHLAGSCNITSKFANDDECELLAVGWRSVSQHQPQLGQSSWHSTLPERKVSHQAGAGLCLRCCAGYADCTRPEWCCILLATLDMTVAPPVCIHSICSILKMTQLEQMCHVEDRLKSCPVRCNLGGSAIVESCQNMCQGRPALTVQLADCSAMTDRPMSIHKNQS